MRGDYQEKAASEHTFQNVGHSVLGVSWQNTAEAVYELGRPEFHNQLPQSFTAENYTYLAFNIKQKTLPGRCLNTKEQKQKNDD